MADKKPNEHPLWLLYTLLELVLVLAFICAISDPLVVGARPPGSAYASASFIIDPLYSLSNIFAAPIYWVAQAFNWVQPNVDSYFPIISGAEFVQLMGSIGWNYPWLTPNIIAGGISLPYLGALLSLLILRNILQFLIEKCRNFFWNLMIEYGFQQNKAKKYEEALVQKTEEFHKLSSQYKNLVQEAHSLKDTIITDEVTMVYNKRFFLDRITKEFDACKKAPDWLSIVMIDIDYFKKLNDAYGHVSGDKVLKAVAQVIKRFAPDMCYACRYGGEEFIIIMPRKNAKQALDVSRYIQENVQLLKFEDIDPRLRITVSQGVCCVDFSHGSSAKITGYDKIIELADQEMYRSKMEGRNRISVYTLVKQNPEDTKG